MTTNYLDSVADFYERVAETPAVGLCCVGGARLALPELCVPPDMEAMSYGCVSSVQPTDLSGSPRVVYVGVGGGKEALEFAYFSRAPGNVIAIEPVAAMRAVARQLGCRRRVQSVVRSSVRRYPRGRRIRIRTGGRIGRYRRAELPLQHVRAGRSHARALLERSAHLRCLHRATYRRRVRRDCDPR